MKRVLIITIVILAVFLAGFVAVAGGSKESKGTLSEKPNIVVAIDGMTCGLCTTAVTKSLSEVEGIKDVAVSLEEGKAYIIGDDTVKDSDIEKAVARAGAYTVVSIERKGSSL